MSLILYKIEFSQLSSADREHLFDQIDTVSWNSMHFHPDLNSGEFALTKESELKLIDFPAGCHVSKK